MPLSDGSTLHTRGRLAQSARLTDNPKAAEWVYLSLGIEVPIYTYPSLVFDCNGKLTGAVAYYQCGPTSISGSICTVDRRWATRANISLMLSIPFERYGCKRLQCEVSEHQDPTFAERLGFTREGTLRQAGPKGEDVAIFSILEHEYRGLRWAA